MDADPNVNNYFLFTTGWKAYKAILEHDYLWHSLAADALKQQLQSRFGSDHEFSFLDLACGDACVTSGVLAEFPLVNYTGVDSSREALSEAEKYTAALGTSRNLVTADFLAFLESSREQFDVIYVGLVAHHLGADRLEDFFRLVKKCLKPSGVFIAHETFHLDDESRDEHCERLARMIRKFWSKMPPEYQQNVIDHVNSSDFPVSLRTWNEKAIHAGLTLGKTLVKTPERLMLVVVHQSN